MKMLANVILLFICCVSTYAQQSDDLPKELSSTGVDEKLGSSIDLNTHFLDEDGNKVELKSFFNSGKPVVLTMAYFRCPMLCTLVLNSVADVVSKQNFQTGKQFELVTISIDPSEKPDLAKQKKTAYVASVKGQENAPKWTFLTGEQSQIDLVAKSIGFKYEYDETIKEYSHPAVVFILTPDGKISRYMCGVVHQPLTFKLALLEAADGKIGTIMDRVMMFCYRYDPSMKGYVLFASRLMKAAGVLFIFVLGGFFITLWRREKRLSMEKQV